MQRTLRLAALLGRRFRVDFVQPRAPVAPFAWALLGSGVFVLAAALVDFAPRWILQKKLSHERAELQARLDGIPGLAKPNARAPDPAGLAQARGVLSQLDRPWPALFDQFESIRTADVHLVQMGIDSQFHTVQIQAEAPTLEQILRYSKLLRRGGPVHAVRLTHHEWRQVPIGRVVVAYLTAELASDAPAEEAPR